MQFSTPTTGALGDLVLQTGDAERPLPPVRLGDVCPARWLCSIRPAVQPPVQVLEIHLQILPVGLPRGAVHPWRRLGSQPQIGLPEALDRDVVQERRELHLLVPFLYLT